MKLEERKKLPICKCGDFKHDHEENGKGACKFKDHHGCPPCNKFKYSHMEDNPFKKYEPVEAREES